MKAGKHLIIAFVAVLLLSGSGYTQSASNREGGFAVIAYYLGHGKDIEAYPVEKLTHIIYSFLHLEGNALRVQSQDSIGITQLVSLKQRNPGLKVIVSLGGWGGCPTCPEVFATPDGRVEFSASVKDLLDKYHADGLDLDWEYPALASVPGFAYSSADKPNFTELIRTLRETLGPDYELSFAAGGFREFLEQSVEWDKVMPYLNYVNLMTYDLVNGYSKSTGHQTPLFSCPGQEGSVDFTVRFLDSIGVPKEKIVIGAAFYARIFRNVENINHGLFQPGQFNDYVNFRDFDSRLGPGSGFEQFWDPVSQAAYSYNRDKQLFATYDEKKSVELKSRYVKDHALGGIMFWSLNGDQHQNGLLDVIDRVRKERIR